MKHKCCNRLMVMIMIVVMVCTHIQAKEIIRSDISFNEMKYEKVEPSEVEKLLEEGKQLTASNDLEKQKEWGHKYLELYYKIVDNSQLLNIYCRMDYTNDYFYTEYQSCIDLISLMESQYIALFGEDESDLSAKTEAYFDLVTKRQELLNDYNNLYQEVTVPVKNQMMNIDALVQQTGLSLKEKQTLIGGEWYDRYNDAAAKIFLQLTHIDQEIAQLEGYPSVIEYMYRQHGRNYSPQDVVLFSKYIKEYIPGIYQEISRKILENIEVLGDYRYTSEEKMMKAVDDYFIHQDPKLQEAYEYLITYDLYHMKPSSKTVPGAFTTYLDGYKEPFMLINDNTPLETMIDFIHEFGHFNFNYQTDNYLVSTDLSEVYAQTLELFALSAHDKITGSKEVAELSKELVLANKLRAILDGCVYNEFCKIVYENPHLTTEELNDLYQSIAQDYGLVVDSRDWVNITHNFEVPFYYLSYTFSGIVAFDLWGEFLKDEEKGKEVYWKLIEAATEKDAYKATQKVGLHDPFKEETIKQIVTIVSDYLGIEQTISK